MAPLLVVENVCSWMISGLISMVAIVTMIATAIMCGCGEKKKQEPIAEDEKPPIEKTSNKEPAPTPSPEDVVEEKKSIKSVKTAESGGEQPSQVKDVSMMMREASDLRLMNKVEGPISAMKPPVAAKSDQPSLMLMGKSVMTPNASPISKSVRTEKSATKSMSVRSETQKAAVPQKSFSMADDRTRAPSVTVQDASIIGVKKVGTSTIGINNVEPLCHDLPQ